MKFSRQDPEGPDLPLVSHAWWYQVCKPQLRDPPSGCGSAGGALVVLALGFAQVPVRAEVSPLPWKALLQEGHQPLLV